MPVPSFDPVTGNLPPGIHDATWSELETALGWTTQRQQFLDGLRRACEQLRSAGCRRVYVDGSFATAKEVPGDFDGCWEAGGVDASALDPVLLDFSSKRARQKAKYGGELFIANSLAGPTGARFLEFFQRDKATGKPKGIIAIDLGGLP